MKVWIKLFKEISEEMNSVKNFLMHSIQFIVCSENIGSEVENEVVREREERLQL